MKAYYSLAWKELMAQKITTILILIAVVLSTMMTTVIGQSLGILKAMQQQQATALNGNRYVTFHQLTQKQKENLSADKRLSFKGSSIALGTSEIPNTKLSIWLREYEDGALAAYESITRLESGQLPQRANEIALPQDALKLLGVSDKLEEPITLPIHISLIRDDQAPFEYSATFILTGVLKSNYVGYVSGGVNGIVGQGTSALLLPAKYQLYSVDTRMSSKSNFQQTVNDLATRYAIPDYCIQYNDVLLTTLGMNYDDKGELSEFSSGFPFMAAAGILVGTLVVLAAGLVIYNILKISVTKRIRDYGTLRAIGAESSQLYALVSLQITVLCGIGIPIGILIGMLGAKGITIAATGLLSPEIFMASSQEELTALIAENSSGELIPLLISAAITLVFAFIAAIPAAKYAARVSPTTAMQGMKIHVNRKNRKIRRIRHFEAFYAKINLRRNTGRTAITILSLFMSITVFIALQSFTSLLDTSIKVQQMHLGDYSITNETVGFPPDMVEKLKAQPDIASVSTIKTSLYTQNEDGKIQLATSFSLQPGEALHIVGVDEERLKMIVPTLTERELQDLKDGKACLVKNPIAMSYGDTQLANTSLPIGETITVNNLELHVIHESSSPVTLDTAGFVNGVQIIVYDTVYDQITGKTNYSEMYPILSSTADRGVIEQIIAQISDEVAGSRWLSFQNTDRQLEESYEQIKLLAWGLILLIGLIGILNIVNTVYTNIHTRITEIGVQRALGMSAASLYKTFLWEGAYYGIIAAIMGSIAGYMSTILVNAATSDTLQLVPVPFIPILEAALVSILACLIATWIPLHKIADRSIVESIGAVE